MPTSRTRRRTARLATAALVVGVLYGGWVLSLFASASEGAVPDPSRIPLPAGAEVFSEERGCASGGCWITISARPPSGQTPADMAKEIGATPRLELRGNIVNPRPVKVWAEVDGDTLTLRADYWSMTYVP